MRTQPRHHSPRLRVRFGVPAAALVALTVAAATGSPAASASPSASGAPSALASSALPIADDQLLRFSDLSDFVADGGELTVGHDDVRRFHAVPEMVLDLEIDDPYGHVKFRLQSPSGADLTNGQVREFAGTLTEAGEYVLVISDAAYAQDIEYWFNGRLVGHSLAAYATHVELTGESRTAELSGELFDPGYDVWSFTNTQAGAAADLTWSGPGLYYQAWRPDFTLITEGFSDSGFSFGLLDEGDHYLRFWQNGSQDPVDYTIQLGVPPIYAGGSGSGGSGTGSQGQGGSSAAEPYDARRLQFPFGENIARVSGQLDDGWEAWIFSGRQDQLVFFTSVESPVYWQLMTLDGNSLHTSAAVNQRSGVELPADGDYLIIVNHPSSVGTTFGSGPAPYEIEVEIPGLYPENIPEPSSAGRFQMARGTHVGDIAGTLAGADIDLWVMGVGAGQTIHIEQLGDAVQWRLLTPLGDAIGYGFGSEPGQVPISESGDYYLQVFTTSQAGQSDYQLRITIPPL